MPLSFDTIGPSHSERPRRSWTPQVCPFLAVTRMECRKKLTIKFDKIFNIIIRTISTVLDVCLWNNLERRTLKSATHLILWEQTGILLLHLPDSGQFRNYWSAAIGVSLIHPDLNGIQILPLLLCLGLHPLLHSSKGLFIVAWVFLRQKVFQPPFVAWGIDRRTWLS